MAENKYLKAMQQASEHVGKKGELELPPASVKSEPVTAKAAPRNVGRPPGKRSNPDWEQITLFVRKDTKRAGQRLRRADRRADGGRERARPVGNCGAAFITMGESYIITQLQNYESAICNNPNRRL